MSGANQFETPENVLIHYESAGLGTRFLAWFVDQFIVGLLVFVLVICAMVFGASFVETIGELVDDSHDGTFFLYLAGLLMLAWGLGSFAYFGGSEFLLRGQTLGKRMLAIRVVSVDGFQLDAGGILVRNLFRVLDQMPPLWIIPVMSSRSQRAGDMVAGTVVISDTSVELSSTRSELSARSPAESVFRFDATKLKRLTSNDFQTVQLLLDRINDLPGDQRARLVKSLATSLANKMKVEPPPPENREKFIEDLLAAEFRRQDRALG